MERLTLAGNHLRCWWCARAITGEARHVNFSMRRQEYQVDVCSERCSEEVIRAYTHFAKFSWLFLTGMGVFILMMILGHGGVVSLCGLMIGGATLTICPFATPQTVLLVGLKKSFIMGRVAGAVLLMGSLILLIALRLLAGS